VLGDGFPTSRLASVQRAIRDATQANVAMLTYMNGRPQLLPAPASEATPVRAHHRSGTVTERTRALLSAELEAARSEAQGRLLARDALEALLAALSRCAERLGRLDDVSIALHDSGYAAVPLAERQRAAGVPRGRVVYSGGRICVAEHQPQYSVTFVAAVAAQVLADGRARLHAVLETEAWRLSGNERKEVWRGRVEVGVDDAAGRAAELGTELQNHLAEAIDAFNVARAV
jgi:hypothetical protein